MRYYFDMLDSADLSADEVGIDFDNDGAAIAEGLQSLSDWTADTTAEIGSRAIMVIIRDESREVAWLTARVEIAIRPAGTI